MTFAVLTVVKWVVQWHEVHSYCCAPITTVRPQNSVHLEKLKLSPCESTTSYPPPPTAAQPLATPSVFSVSMNLTTLGISCKWNHVIFVFL